MVRLLGDQISHPPGSCFVSHPAIPGSHPGDIRGVACFGIVVSNEAVVEEVVAAVDGHEPDQLLLWNVVSSSSSSSSSLAKEERKMFSLLSVSPFCRSRTHSHSHTHSLALTHTVHGRLCPLPRCRWRTRKRKGTSTPTTECSLPCTHRRRLRSSVVGAAVTLFGTESERTKQNIEVERTGSKT